MQTRSSAYDNVYASRREEFMAMYDRRHCLPQPTKTEEIDAAKAIHQYAGNKCIQQRTPAPVLTDDGFIEVRPEWGAIIQEWRQKYQEVPCPMLPDYTPLEIPLPNEAIDGADYSETNKAINEEWKQSVFQKYQIQN